MTTVAETIAIEPIDAFEATVRPPGSKSLTNRALLLAALAGGRSSLSGVLFSDDTRVMLDALAGLGFDLNIDESERTVAITGRAGEFGPDKSAVAPRDLHLGNAGTAYRFLTAALCLGHGVYRLDGIARMRERPIEQLVTPLRELGAAIDYEGREGFPPLRITGGGLRGGELTFAPTLSSQYISALLQIGPCLPDGIVLHFDGPITSRPYVEMTLALMARFGASIDADPALTRIAVAPGGYQALDLAIEPDASNASYFLAAAAMIPGARCTVEGLGRGSLQGDVGFADLLHAMGAGLLFGRDFITVIGPPADQPLQAIDIDLGAMPDMAQTLAAVALFAKGTTTMRNIGNLRIKETDRLAALRNELTKLGATVEIDGDDLSITPPADGRIKPASIETYDDHRMAMSFAIIGLRAPGITILDPSCVNKTYPDFFHDLARLGATPAKPPQD